MSKSIRSYPKEFRNQVAKRRINAKTMGLGYWAAQDYLTKVTFKGHLKKGETAGEAELQMLERIT